MEKENKPLAEKWLNEDEIGKEENQNFYFNSDDVKQAVKEAYEHLIGHFCSCTNDMRLRWEECDDCHQIKQIFKDKFGFELEKW